MNETGSRGRAVSRVTVQKQVEVLADNGKATEAVTSEVVANSPPFGKSRAANLADRNHAYALIVRDLYLFCDTLATSDCEQKSHICQRFLAQTIWCPVTEDDRAISATTIIDILLLATPRQKESIRFVRADVLNFIQHLVADGSTKLSSCGQNCRSICQCLSQRCRILLEVTGKVRRWIAAIGLGLLLARR